MQKILFLLFLFILPVLLPYIATARTAVPDPTTPSNSSANNNLNNYSNDDSDRNGLTIMAIIISTTQKTVMINNQSYHVGDIVGQFQITQIFPDYIILKNMSPNNNGDKANNNLITRYLFNTVNTVQIGISKNNKK